MNYGKMLFVVLSTGVAVGCSNLQGAKLLMPEQFGLTRIGPLLYVETGADEGTKTKLRAEMSKARNAVRAAYGDVKSHPIVHACVSEACYESFGGMGSRAKIYGNRILLSRRGFNWHFLAHEWSHDEIRTRLTWSAWRRLPQWFDEGLAVTVSEAPEHSDAHWQFLVAADVARPSRSELFTYRSRSQWLDAVHRYGETKNAERRERGESEIRPVYTAAGHAVRPWLAKVGTRGLLELIQRLNEGETLETIYLAGDGAGETGVPQAASSEAPRPSS
jgi:hypothetical protein